MTDAEQINPPAFDWRMIWGIIGACILGSLIVFGAALSHGFSMIDDPYLVTQNLFVRGLSFENFRYVFTHFDPELYMPLTLVSYQFDYLIGGLNPTLFHATNILLHGINAALVMGLLWLLTKHRTAAIFGGLLFLVHPLNTEAVVWVAGRKDLLSTGFFLGSLIAFILSQTSAAPASCPSNDSGFPRHDAAAAGEISGKRWFYWLSIGLFLLALLSKAMVLTLPAILLLIILIDRKQNQLIANSFPTAPRLRGAGKLIALLPYCILSAIFAAIALIGKERVVQSSTLLETILMAGKSTVFYLQKFLWPSGLTPIYPYHNPIVISSPDFALPLIILVIILVAAIISLKWTRWISIGLAFFLITLSPTFLNFHKGTVTFFAVDRYAYLPMIGVLIAVCGMGTQRSDQRSAISDQIHVVLRSIPAVLIGILISFALLSIRQTATWSSDERLLTRSLLLYPDSIPTRTSLSVIYRQEGRINDERSVIEAGLTYRDDVAYRTGLGSIFAREGKIEEARNEYERGRKLDPKNPEPHFFIGSLEEQLNNPDKALADYKAAIALDDSYVGAYTNAGAILLDRGEFAEAEKLFRSALTWNPSTMEANYNLFDVLEREKKPEEAFPYLVRAYTLNPDDPDIGLSYAYRLNELGRKTDAKQVLEHLLEIDSSNRAATRLLQNIQAAPNR